VGLEPTIHGLRGRCPIYWVTETQHSGPRFLNAIISMNNFTVNFESM
jgi:hypothetical protein